MAGQLDTNPFVGRDREMSELAATLGDVAAGRGRLVMLVGEPGIGKTRTAEELASIASQRSFEVLWGRCLELFAPPFWPWIQIVRTYLEGRELSELRSVLGARAAEIAVMVSDIRDRIPDLPESPVAQDVETARFRLFDAVASFLRRASHDRPVMIVLDDLHWADASSLRLLEFLGSGIEDAPILVVGTYRDVEVERDHPLFHALGNLSRQRIFSRVLLRGLTQNDIEGVVTRATNGVGPSALAALVYQNTEGNPFFVRELLRLLAEEGLLTGTRAARQDFGSLRLPEGVREVIGRRMARLSQPCNEVLSVASAIGPEFDLALLSRLVRLRPTVSQERDIARNQGTGSGRRPGFLVPFDQPGTGPEHSGESARGNRVASGAPLLEVLDEALSARLIQTVPGKSTRFRFRHALIQRALAQGIPTTRRVRLHALIADALEAMYGERAADHSGEIAAHLAEAGGFYEPAKLTTYSILAGEQALDSLGFHEAAHLFEIAEQAAGEARMSVETQRWDTLSEPSHDSLMARIWFNLGKARAGTAFLRDDRQQVWEILHRAFDAYVRLGDSEKAVDVARTGMDFGGLNGLVEVTEHAVQIAVPDSAGCGYLLTRHAIALMDERGDLRGANDTLQAALTIAAKLQDRRLEALAHVHLAHTAYAECNYPSSIDESLISLANGGGEDDRIAVRAYAFIIPAMLACGDLNGAGSFAELYLRESERLRFSSWLAHARFCAWAVAAARGDQQAMRFAREEVAEGADGPSATMAPYLETFELVAFGSSERGTETRLPSALHLRQFNYLQADMVMGILATAAYRLRDPALITAAEALAKQMLSTRPELLRVTRPARQGLGFVAAARGDPVAATALYPEALLAKGQFGRLAGFSVDRLLGLLARTMGNASMAEGHFEEAVMLCEKTGFASELAWTCYDYIDLLVGWNRPGTHDRIVSLLAKGKKVAGSLAMRPLIERFTLIEERTAGAPGNTRFPRGLTGREIEVLRLIAAGKSNAQIGDALVISPATAAKHVANILGKISAANRAEAATYANKNGLVS